MNFAYLMGWKRIVLVGVDLYDSRYFCVGKDEETHVIALRGISHKEVHMTAKFKKNNIVNVLQHWNPFFKEKQISLEVYNPKSLLVSQIKTFDRSEIYQHEGNNK